MINRKKMFSSISKKGNEKKEAVEITEEVKVVEKSNLKEIPCEHYGSMISLKEVFDGE